MSQIKKSIFAVFSIALLVAFSSSASAQCSRAEVVGTWRIYALSTDNTGQVRPMRCTLTLNPTAFDLTKSNCWVPGVGVLPVTAATITVNPSCHATGSITVTGFPTTAFDAWYNKDQNSISGISYDTTLKTVNMFSGQRQ